MSIQIDTAYSPKLLLGLEALWREQIFVDTTLVFGRGSIRPRKPNPQIYFSQILNVMSNSSYSPFRLIAV